jgi:hypothetical protein
MAERAMQVRQPIAFRNPKSRPRVPVTPTRWPDEPCEARHSRGSASPMWGSRDRGPVDACVAARLGSARLGSATLGAAQLAPLASGIGSDAMLRSVRSFAAAPALQRAFGWVTACVCCKRLSAHAAQCRVGGGGVREAHELPPQDASIPGTCRTPS